MRRKLVFGGLALTCVVLVAIPVGLTRAVVAGLRDGLARHDLLLREGQVEVSLLRGAAAVNALRIERDLPEEHTRVVVEEGRVRYALGEVLEDPPRVAEVALRGVEVRVVRRGRRARAERTPRALLLDRVVVEQLTIVVEDRGPETASGSPFLLEAAFPAAEVRDLRPDDVLWSVMQRARGAGTLGGGGTVELSEGALVADGVGLTPFSTYLAQAAGLAIDGGRGRLWATSAVEESAEGERMRVQLYLEVEGLEVRALSGARPDLLRDASVAALAAYMNLRGAFFAHAFELELPRKLLTGRPAHDSREAALLLAQALIASLIDDRVDPRRPSARPLHPHLDDAAKLAAALAAAPPARREEVFQGALEGRLLDALSLRITDTGKALLGLGRPRLRGEVTGVDAALRVEVRAWEASEAVGAEVTLQRLRIVGLREREGVPELVVEPRGE